MNDTVQQIKERLNIVDIIGQYVKLTKAGRNYKGLSPFKKEKTPSFYVNPDKGMYYDFSTNQGGDIFTFIQTVEGLDFKGALQMLADRAGVEVRHEDKGTKDLRDRVYATLEAACKFYETKFLEHRDAQEYLASRGVEPAIMRSFRIGFALNEWQSLYDYLRSQNFSDQEIERAGLIKRGEKGAYYDRFRSRIMFPIADTAGRIVAFSGRIFGEAAKDEKNAKYLNSPETELFDKSRILYGYDKAKQYIRKYDFSILVEGQMDIVMSHQAGYHNTVAVSGTGLTEHHLALLDRLSPKLVLAFDADIAGITSTGRAAALALPRGIDVKVATIPLGKDPADCIKENADLWKQAVREAQPVVNFFLTRALTESGSDDRKRSLHIRDTVLPYIARIKSGVDQAHFVRTVANAIGLAEDAIWQDVRSHARILAREETTRGATAIPVQPVQKHTEEKRTRREELERELAGFLYWQNTVEPRKITDAELAERTVDTGIDLATIIAHYSGEQEVLALRAELIHDTAQEPLVLLGILVRAVLLETLREERSIVTTQLRDAERVHDSERTEQLLKDFKNVSKRIDTLANHS